MDEEGKKMSGKGFAARVGAALKAFAGRRRTEAPKSAAQEWAEIAERAVEDTARMLENGPPRP